MRSTELEQKVTSLDIGTKTYNNARARLTEQGLIKSYQAKDGWHVKLQAA